MTSSMTTSLRATGLVATLLVAACRVGASVEPEGEATVAAAEVKVGERIRLDLGRIAGISGLTRDGDGRLWAVPERVRALVPIELSGSHPGVAGAVLPLIGVPDGLDTESIAWLSERRFLLGTESHRAIRTEDLVLVVEREERRAQVIDTIPLSYAELGFRPSANQGLEALCVVGDTVLVGLEAVVEAGPTRWAHLFRTELTARRWQHLRLRLSSATGKLAALECRREGEQVIAVAIERHYGVARLLRFELPMSGRGLDVEPSLVVDLGAQVRGVPNMEGIAWGAPGEVVIVVDNDTGGVTGPNEALIVRGPGL